MAREGLMDDSGYMGFEECSRYEECSYDAYKQGREDAIDEFALQLKEMCKKEILEDGDGFFYDVARFMLYDFDIDYLAEQLKEKKK